MNNKIFKLALSIIVISPFGNASATAATDEKEKPLFYYDGTTHLVMPNGRSELRFEGRLQSRISDPFDSNPKSVDALQEKDTIAEFNRSRVKAVGNILVPWVYLRLQYALESSRLMDININLEYSKAIQFRFGRMVAHYNNERIASSKDQLMIDRSILNDYFILDRQQGITMLGQVDKDGLYSFDYALNVFKGTGRDGHSENNDYMVGGRFQWNVMGGRMKYASSDIELRDKPTVRLAFATSTNKSRYTKFSAAGGGQLSNFSEHAEDDGFKLDQWMLEARYKYNGLAIDAEYHQKKITDEFNTLSSYYSKYTSGDSVRMTGFYAQSGYHPHAILPSFPKNIELTARYAQVKPDSKLNDSKINEFALGSNWYIKGRRNKLTFDVTLYEVEEDSTVNEGLKDDKLRFRLQHDISF